MFLHKNKLLYLRHVLQHMHTCLISFDNIFNY